MIKLDPKSRKSIYEQVVDNLKELIMTGRLLTGDKLPSVRELAKEIAVNPNTVSKAYRELERQGYIYTTAGVGTFVSDAKEIQPDQTALQKAKEEIAHAFAQLLYLGIPFQDAKEMTMAIIEERRPEHD